MMAKSDHFGDMIDTTKERGFLPEKVPFDGWYSSLVNLGKIDAVGWRWWTRLKHIRRANPEGTQNRPIGECEITETGKVVQMENFGIVKAVRNISIDGTAENWATNGLEMDDMGRLRLAEAS